MNPNSRIEAAICATCSSECVARCGRRGSVLSPGQFCRAATLGRWSSPFTRLFCRAEKSAAAVPSFGSPLDRPKTCSSIDPCLVTVVGPAIHNLACDGFAVRPTGLNPLHFAPAGARLEPEDGGGDIPGVVACWYKVWRPLRLPQWSLRPAHGGTVCGAWADCTALLVRCHRAAHRNLPWRGQRRCSSVGVKGLRPTIACVPCTDVISRISVWDSRPQCPLIALWCDLLRYGGASHDTCGTERVCRALSMPPTGSQ